MNGSISKLVLYGTIQSADTPSRCKYVFLTASSEFTTPSLPYIDKSVVVVSQSSIYNRINEPSPTRELIIIALSLIPK